MRVALALALALAGTVAIACPPAAAAADLGGGTAPDGTGRPERALTLVTVRTAADGTAVVRAAVLASCGRGDLRRRVTLAPDGSFTVRGTARRRAGDEAGVRVTARMAVTGRLAGTAGVGTVRARLTLRRGPRVVERCRSGPRTWQLRAAVPDPAPGPPRAGGAYHGLTSQTAGRPHAFLLRVGPGGRRVRAAVFQYRLHCLGGAYESDNLTPGGPIGADGTFSLRERFTLRHAGAEEGYTVAVDGRFTATGVSGTLSVATVARRPGGRVFDRCATGAGGFTGAL